MVNSGGAGIDEGAGNRLPASYIILTAALFNMRQFEQFRFLRKSVCLVEIRSETEKLQPWELLQTWDGPGVLFTFVCIISPRKRFCATIWSRYESLNNKYSPLIW